jgi:signal transduction histidine kinase/ActR/RegA family two-component response regulator
MLFDSTVVGALCLWRTDVRPFDDRAAALITTFAAQAAIAITHVGLVRTLEARTAELARKVEQLQALGAVIETVNSSLDLDEVLSTIGRHAVQLSATDGGSIMEFDDQRAEFAVRAAFGTSPELMEQLRQTPIRLTETLVGRAAKTGRALQEPDLRLVRRDPHQERLFRAGWLSMLAVPLLREQRIVGILVVRRKSAGRFSDEIAEMLQSFADQTAVAILNARVFRELERKSRELEIASRHKSEFLASMSHELRTPLNAVIGFSEVLLERMFGDLNERQDEYLRDILNSGHHLLELLSDVLDLSKIEAGRMELDRSTFAVRDVVDDSLVQVRERAAQRGITVECDVPREAGQLFADRRRIRQVILNLLSNAVKFTPPGGRIIVRATNDDGQVLIAVSDTGPGVPVQDRERIFESFQQGGRGIDRQEGTGLGLTLSRRIVQEHAGRLWLDSDVGVGSTFYLALPVTGVGEHAAAPPAEPSTDDPVVVIVEDDPGSMELLTLYVEGIGAAAVSAGNGADGLELTRRVAPAAVVLDIQLPDVDGWELIASLKKDPATTSIPILIVSIVDERNRGLALGAAEYLVKPVSRESVQDALLRLGVRPTPPTAAVHAPADQPRSTP